MASTPPRTTAALPLSPAVAASRNRSPRPLGAVASASTPVRREQSRLRSPMPSVRPASHTPTTSVHRGASPGDRTSSRYVQYDLAMNDDRASSLSSAQLDALNAKEEEMRLKILLEEAQAFRQLSLESNSNEKALLLRQRGSRRSSPPIHRRMVVPPSPSGKKEDDADDESVPRHSPTRRWHSYREEWRRQGNTSSMFGPAGQLPLVLEYDDGHGSAEVEDAPPLLRKPTIVDVAVTLLEKRDRFEADVRAAHSMLLLNVARALAAEFHHNNRVRDDAVRRLLRENAQMRRAEGSSGPPLAEVYLRRRVVSLRAQLETATKASEKSQAAFREVSNELAAVKAALASQRQREHEDPHLQAEHSRLKQAHEELRSRIRSTIRELESPQLFRSINHQDDGTMNTQGRDGLQLPHHLIAELTAALEHS